MSLNARRAIGGLFSYGFAKFRYQYSRNRVLATHLSRLTPNAAGHISRLLASKLYSFYPQNSVDDEPLCKPHIGHRKN